MSMHDTMYDINILSDERRSHRGNTIQNENENENI